MSNAKLRDLVLSAEKAALSDHWGPDVLQLNEAILMLDPRNISALNRIARCLLATGNVEGARPLFRQVLDIEPTNIIANNRLREIDQIRPMRTLLDGTVLELISKWEGDNFALLPYFKDRGQPASQVVNRFKDEDVVTILAVAQLLIDELERYEGFMRDERGARYVTSIPRSTAGIPNRPADAVCQRLCRRFAWLQHIPALVTRATSLRSSRLSSPGHRPRLADHLRTIRCSTQSLSGAVIIVDDNITRGCTSTACRQLIQRETGGTGVLGIFISRTQTSDPAWTP